MSALYDTELLQVHALCLEISPVISDKKSRDKVDSDARNLIAKIPAAVGGLFEKQTNLSLFMNLLDGCLTGLLTLLKGHQ
jgi:hypothetical protein